MNRTFALLKVDPALAEYIGAALAISSFFATLLYGGTMFASTRQMRATTTNSPTLRRDVRRHFQVGSLLLTLVLSGPFLLQGRLSFQLWAVGTLIIAAFNWGWCMAVARRFIRTIEPVEWHTFAED